AVTASDLRRHAQFRERPRMRVAVTGSRGLVGSELVPFLTTGGHSVVRLVSKTPPQPLPAEGRGFDDFPPSPLRGGAGGGVLSDDGTQYVAWNPQEPLDPATLDGCDAVIHLAGDNIGDGRWNAAKR